MLYDPVNHHKPEETAEHFKQHSKLYERFMRLKQSKFLKLFLKKENGGGSSTNSGRSLFRFF
ncbi:hypothetical protein D3C71_1702050 [compost metagenome]